MGFTIDIAAIAALAELALRIGPYAWPVAPGIWAQGPEAPRWLIERDLHTGVLGGALWADVYAAGGHISLTPVERLPRGRWRMFLSPAEFRLAFSLHQLTKGTSSRAPRS